MPFFNNINKIIKKDYDSCLIDVLGNAGSKDVSNRKVIKKVESIIKNAEENHYILKINKIRREKSPNKGFTPLSLAIITREFKIVQLIIEYALKHSLSLNINERENDDFDTFPFLLACEINEKKNTKIAKLLIEYANKEDYIIKVNQQDSYGQYALLEASSWENSEMIEVIINYANSKNIILNMNEKNVFGNRPIVEASRARNVAGVQALLNYADKNSIILNMEKDEDDDYPLLEAISTNSYEMVKSLLEYSKKNNIVLKFDEYDLESNIRIKKKQCRSSRLKQYDVGSLSEVDSKIIELLNYYRKMGTLDYIEDKMSNMSDEETESIIKLMDDSISSSSIPLSPSTSKSQVSSISEKNDQIINENSNEYDDSKEDSIENNNEKRKEKSKEKSKEKNNEKNNEKSKEESKEKYNEKGDLAVVLYNFSGTTSDELALNKNEYLIVTKWNVGDGYAIGYKRDDPQQKGKFPSPLVRKCSENIESNNIDNDGERLPTYEESVNARPFTNTTPMIYHPFNSSYVVPPEVATTQYVIPVTTNQSYIFPISQPSLVSESSPYVSVPILTYTIPLNQQPSAPPETSSNQQPIGSPEASSSQQPTAPPEMS